MVKKKDIEVDKIDNLWNAIGFFFKYVFVKHFWKVCGFFLLVGVLLSGFTFRCGNFSFNKTDIKLKAQEGGQHEIYNQVD